MSARTVPPFRADHVGSLLRPASLVAARGEHAAGRLSAEKLRAEEDAAIAAAVAMQQRAGLQSVTDGEFRRATWHMDFIYQIGGISKAPGNLAVKFHNPSGDIEWTPAALHVGSKLRMDKTIFGEDFQYLQSLAAQWPSRRSRRRTWCITGVGRRRLIRVCIPILRSSGRIWRRRTRMRWAGWPRWAAGICSLMTRRWRT
jgi:hypothetical protein